MKHFDRLKSKMTLVCRSAVMALAAMMVGVTALTFVPQAAAAISVHSHYTVKNCHGIEVGIFGNYYPSTNETYLLQVTATDLDFERRSGHNIRIELRQNGKWVEVLNRQDVYLGAVLGFSKVMKFNKSPGGVVVKEPPTRIRFNIKADRPGKDFRCKDTRRVEL